ncbi:type II toxin-antitoxin system RelE/ParE family toxin [Danxiaibacter flavus]|uniref:Type II toxin-antitoxin system RelE/ParE family toxin n=1 Tax=Danxiaibacter flavus TaxID=3049108 RepID=A0ABV3ZBR5_9BACT|nr:type II toxin-antitoxin system RelE/ParE family toxin [Chitinophagaceae bacterium DXS]
MSYKIEFHPEALKEIQESYSWYEDRSAGLGKRFIEAIDYRLSLILNDPERYPKKKASYREISIHIFPYIIIYEILKKEKIILVYYVFHMKKNPKRKFRRSSK